MKCWPIVSCLDRRSMLRHFSNGEEPSNNTTQNQPNNSCKPTDFRRILQFTCGNDLAPLSLFFTSVVVGMRMNLKWTTGSHLHTYAQQCVCCMMLMFCGNIIHTMIKSGDICFSSFGILKKDV